MSPKPPVKSGLCSGCALLDAAEIQFEGERDPDILIVGSFPLEFDINCRGAFRSHGGKMVRSMLSRAIAGLPRHKQPRVAFCYAVRCCPVKNSYKVSADTISQCRQRLLIDIERWRPKVLVALGADATKALGLTASLGQLRGHFYKTTFTYGQAEILPTYHPGAINKNPGLTGILNTDLQKAVRYVSEGFDEDQMDLDTPVSFHEVMEALDRADKHINKIWLEKGHAVLVSADTETTSLHPWDKAQRMIAMSISYAENQGLAFPWKHRKAPFSALEFEQIHRRVEQIIGSEKVYLVEHNAKFDTQWINGHNRLNVAYPKWDTMLVEHLVDEDKKGEYGLKSLTLDYFPGYGKYEQELEKAKQAVAAEKLAVYKEAEAAYKTQLQTCLVAYWLQLSYEQRSHLAAGWVNSGYLKLADTSGLSELKYRKVKGKQVLLKKCQTAIVRMLKKLPEDVLPVDLVQKPDKTAMTEVTYEDVPLMVLLKYAAIDALVTRKLVSKQLLRINDDDRLIARVEELNRAKLNTKPLMWAKDNITMPMCHLIARMEYKGVLLDREKTKKYVRVMDRAIAAAEDKMFTEIGYRFNPNSAELPKILFEQMKLPVIKRSEKTDAPSTDADTIKQLYDRFDIPFLQQLLVFRKLEKQRNTYLLNWLEMSSVDGRIHASFNQTGTATYRLSSSGPNLQNVTFFVKEAALEFVKEEFADATKDGLNIKELFIPDPGYEIYDLDISNAEMRILCAYSGDEVLIGVFNDGKCMHCLTASGISEYSYADIKANKENKETVQYQVRQIGKKVSELAFSKAA